MPGRIPKSQQPPATASNEAPTDAPTPGTAASRAASFVAPKGRFTRSVNIERDANRAISGYLPTGRALDVIGRIGRALEGTNPSRAFSITGPYGTGKSSLAVFFDAIVGPAGAARAEAIDVLRSVSHEDADLFEVAVTHSDHAERGFIRAVTTASREPVAATVTRALAAGARRYTPARDKAGFNTVVRGLDDAVAGLADRDRPLPSTRYLRDTVATLSDWAPVLLLIDEFGKNLEAFSDSRSEADLFLLQELVEWAHDGRDVRLLTITMQHLAFDEYLDTVSQTLRREWAKVQGRFEDIPYVDTPAQTRHLIGQVNTHSDNADYRQARARWAKQETAAMRDAGLGHEAAEATVAAAWPLHPSALLVLPDLCARYGQNERTLFSFLASGEPLAVPSWVANTGVDLGGGRRPLPSIRLDRVYDYFVESAATMVGTSQTASRWVEIETAMRDAAGLTPAERRVLKAVGLLNLITAGGTIRASRQVLGWACADGDDGTGGPAEVNGCLDRLEQASRVTYREFADEFRLWRGSDIDLRAAIETARRRVRALPVEELLGSTRDMLPVVAARYSTKTGTLRAFVREWDSDGRIDALGAGSGADGLLVYAVGDRDPQLPTEDAVAGAKPVVIVRPDDTGRLVAAAVELAAVRDVLADTGIVGDDWVARRELIEREAETLARFDAAFEAAAGHGAGATWTLIAAGDTRSWPTPASLSAGLSDVCDVVYPDTPPVPNEMLNRQQLTSQGAKARRLLIEAVLAKADTPSLGLDASGFPPERAMHDALLGASGIHRSRDGVLRIGAPTRGRGWDGAWAAIGHMLDLAQRHRVGIDRILDELAAPPIGLKAGPGPVLVVCAILDNRGEVALYEHGTYRPRLAPDIVERLLRNPSHFEIKHFAAARGPRRVVVGTVAEYLGIATSWRNTAPSVLTVVSHLVATANALTAYARRTRTLSARRPRSAGRSVTPPSPTSFCSRASPPPSVSPRCQGAVPTLSTPPPTPAPSPPLCPRSPAPTTNSCLTSAVPCGRPRQRPRNGPAASCGSELRSSKARSSTPGCGPCARP